MSEMTELLDRMYARVWHERDLEAAFDGLPEDFEWIVPGHPDGDVHRGPRAVLAFFRDWIDQWEDAESEWELEQTSPDTVLSCTTTRGRGRASGVPVELHFAQVWTFRGGVPIRMRLHADADSARRAARAERSGR